MQEVEAVLVRFADSKGNRRTDGAVLSNVGCRDSPVYPETLSEHL
jgi:hypothetical protein